MKKIAVGCLLAAGILVFSGCGDSSGRGDSDGEGLALTPHEEIVKELYSLLMEGADRQKFDTFAKKHWDEKELDQEYPKEGDKVWKKVFPTVAKAKKSVRTEVVKTDSDYRGNVPYSVVKATVNDESVPALYFVVKGRDKESSKIVDIAPYTMAFSRFYRFSEGKK
jgi:hypothetical protein